MNTEEEHTVSEIYYPLGIKVQYLRRTGKPLQCDDPELQTCRAETFSLWLEKASVPESLAGFQCIENGHVRRGDLLVHRIDIFWADDFYIGASLNSAHLGHYSVYRKLPVANHADIAAPEVKALIEEHNKTGNNHDPKGEEGKKKPQLQLIPPVLNTQLANALAFGAYHRKDPYGPWNWRKNKVEYMTYIGAIKRHIDALLEREDVASDSGVHHLGHIAASCAIVLDAAKHGTLVDNRPPAKLNSEPVVDNGAFKGVE